MQHFNVLKCIFFRMSFDLLSSEESLAELVALNDMVENEGMSSPPQSSLSSSSSSPSLPLSPSPSSTSRSSDDPDYDADNDSDDSDNSHRQPQVKRRYRFHPKRLVEMSDSMNERRFLSNFRMSKSIFEKLLVAIAPHLPIGLSTNGKSLSARERLLTFMWYVGGNTTFMQGEYAHDMSYGSVYNRQELG
jgi:hypothetical protein